MASLISLLQKVNELTLAILLLSIYQIIIISFSEFEDIVSLPAGSMTPEQVLEKVNQYLNVESMDWKSGAMSGTVYNCTQVLLNIRIQSSCALKKNRRNRQLAQYFL